LKGTHPGTIPATARFGLIWFSGFKGKDLNVIFYQNMPNLHNRYKWTGWLIGTKVTPLGQTMQRNIPAKFGPICFSDSLKEN
jgi:hypothetical protein